MHIKLLQENFWDRPDSFRRSLGNAKSSNVGRLYVKELYKEANPEKKSLIQGPEL